MQRQGGKSRKRRGFNWEGETCPASHRKAFHRRERIIFHRRMDNWWLHQGVLEEPGAPAGGIHSQMGNGEEIRCFIVREVTINSKALSTMNAEPAFKRNNQQRGKRRKNLERKKNEKRKRKSEITALRTDWRLPLLHTGLVARRQTLI